jgi:2-dehydro-3-deoxygluconokinase
VSCLGDYKPGQLVLDRVRAEGMDTAEVRRLQGSPTGLYLRETVGHDVRVYYHLTRITPALSNDGFAFVLWAAREARRFGARVSFDVNYRSRLWPPGRARNFLEKVLPDVDLLFVGDEEARALCC